MNAPTASVRVMCATDRSFIRFLPTMLNSVLRNTSATLEVGVLTQGVSQAHMAEIERLLPDVHFRFFPIDEAELDGLSRRFLLSPMSYARLLMPERVDWDRFIYLDIDVIARADLATLYEIDLGDAPAAAVMHGGHLNAGVMVINAAAWRARKLARQILEYAKKHRPVDADQEAIDAVIGPELRELPKVWNTLVDPIWYRRAFSNPEHFLDAHILHYIKGFKPWNLGAHIMPRQYRDEWRKYRLQGRLPRDWANDATTLLWQLRILTLRALGRC